MHPFIKIRFLNRGKKEKKTFVQACCGARWYGEANLGRWKPDEVRFSNYPVLIWCRLILFVAIFLIWCIVKEPDEVFFGHNHYSFSIILLLCRNLAKMKSSLGNQLEDMKRLAEGEARDKVLVWKFFMINDQDGNDDGNDDWEASGEVTFSKKYLLHHKIHLVTSGGVVIIWWWWWSDMEFVQNFTPPEFQAKTFTP